MKIWPFSRKKAAASRSSIRASFGGAVSNRLTADWTAILLSADRETRSSLRVLRARSRQLCRDNAHAAGLIAALKDNVIGGAGMGPNPRMRSPRGKLLKRENLEVWTAFQEWGERFNCTVDGQNCWSEVQRLALGTGLTDGECFLREIPGFDNPFGLALQFLDADQLDESFNVPPGKGQNEITQGVEVDRWGRPVAYHFWESHPSEWNKTRLRRRVPASEIHHLFLQLRPNQHRGLPIMTPVLIALKMIDGYNTAEVTAAAVAASQGGFFTKTGDDAAANPTTPDPENPTQVVEFEAEPGLSRVLPDGYRFEEWNPAHPNGNHAEFMKTMLRVFARGVNSSYITISGDLSDTSYASGRQGLIAERDAYRVMQRFVGERICIPVYRSFLRYGSLSGAVDLPTPESSRWMACQLEPRGWPWVDPKNDAETAEIELANLLTSPQRICSQRGEDYEEILDEIQEAKEMCQERGIEYPDLLARRAAKGQPSQKEEKPAKPTNGNGNSAYIEPLPVEAFQR